ncbi:four helix bundle protein [Nitrosophilus kaiyonis]|uniref:four helix bundle protein n=1 Tax=Nitrosophilus kaiyonis TaxID=2930200 RepID=UPI0024917668|nr:four helix bundle protein [Nitrosophilus kaiyonis]
MNNKLGKLEIYQKSLKLSEMGWEIFKILPRQYQFDIGSQFLNSCDSIGANIAEGYGRYHYKDKIKFYYNARGSLWEAKHWLLLLYKRNFIKKVEFEEILNILNDLGKQINNFIKTTGKKSSTND